MKRIYLMRHGSAEDATIGSSDADRSLSAKGVAQARSAARALVEMDEIPGLFASSTLLRARQTAGIIAAELDAEKPAETDTLDPGLDPNALCEWLREQHGDSILLAGHAPSIGEFASWLIAGDTSVGIHFAKAAIMCLSLEGVLDTGSCELEWFLTSRQLEHMAD